MSSSASIVVTGASTGIGYATAKYFAARGWRVFAGVRSTKDAERLKRELSVVPLLLDVTDEAATLRASAVVNEALEGVTLAGLVNNAGIVVAGPLLYMTEEQFQLQMDVNVLGPARVIRAFGPLLGTDRSRKGKPGRIVQMSSMSGRFCMPFMAPYAASKLALEGMSESLRRELMLFGIGVSVVCPGPIATPIWEKGEKTDETPFLNTEYVPAFRKLVALSADMGRKGMPPERVSKAVWHAMTARHPKLRYVVVSNPLREMAPRLLPERLLDKMVGRMLGLTRR